jgi:alanine-glyoxylate transaminase/serine-glyoxylate transaminase/serine-pyruvate transaminase
MVPDGHDADAVRRVILDDFDVSLGTGLAQFATRVFRIGHLGHFNDAALLGTLGSIEIGLLRAGIPVKPGGVEAALNYLRADR